LGGELSIEVWKAEGANGDGQTKMFVDELVEKGSSGFSSKLVPFVAEKAPTSIVSVHGAVGAAAIGWGLDLEGVSVANVADVLNPMMRKIFGDLLAEVDVAYVPGLDYWLSASADPTKAGLEPSTSPGNMFCSLFPEVTNKPSPGVNRLYQNEFIDDGNGPVRYNDKFWNGQRVFKMQKDSGKLIFMELCGMIPECLLAHNQLAAHRDALNWLNNHGCGLGGQFFKLIVYRGYVAVLMSFLNSPMVKKARLYGFHPLFLIKNSLLGKNNFGVNGMQFGTIDKDAKSTILLVGFWRKKFNHEKNLEVLAINACGTLLAYQKNTKACQTEFLLLYFLIKKCYLLQT
jgi:hypothetical protein